MRFVLLSVEFERDLYGPVSLHGEKVVPHCSQLIADTEHFYVLEDWVIDKEKGNGITGWVSGCHGYQRQVIQGLAGLVK